MKQPLITVITVVRNGAATIRKSAESVLEQDYPDLQYVVVDGASTDGTTEILQSLGDRVTWVSEPDSGIYDAMNKGLQLARGEWVCFLGADDRFSGPGVLSAVASRLDGAYALVAGAVRYPDGRRVRSRLGLRTLLHNTVHHQGAFYHARLFSGWRYDDRFRIVADYELNLMIRLQRERFLQLDEEVALCGDGGVSLVQWKTALRETHEIRAKHLGAAANFLCSLLNLGEMGGYRLLLALKGEKSP